MRSSQPTLTQNQFIYMKPVRKLNSSGKCTEARKWERTLEQCSQCYTPRQKRPCELCTGDDSSVVFDDILEYFKKNTNRSRHTRIDSIFKIDSPKKK